MLKPTMEYKIESCSADDNGALETLLNEMSSAGWDLYSLNETDSDGDICYSCIFVREKEETLSDTIDDLSSLGVFKNKFERLMNVHAEPFEQCKSVQQKIKDKRLKINQIKSLIDETSEDQRSKLNEEISKNIDDLRLLLKELRAIISPDIMIPKIGEDKLMICLSEELIDLVNPDLDANLVAQTVKARQDFTDKTGYVIPRVRFQDDETLDANEYSIKIRGIVAFRGRVFPGHEMFFSDELNLSELPEYAITDTDSYLDRDVVWIPVEKTKKFWVHGQTAAEVIAKNLQHTTVKYIDELFDYTDVNCYLEIVGLQNSYLIENIIPDFLSVAEVKFILSSLLKEQISIKDILFIFEKINDFADETSKEDLLERIRISLKRQISAGLADTSGIINAFELSCEKVDYFEHAICAISQNDNEENINNDNTEHDCDIVRIAIDNNKVIKLVKKLKSAATKYKQFTCPLVLIVPVSVRYLLSILLTPLLPNIKVVAKEELSEEYELEILSEI